MTASAVAAAAAVLRQGDDAPAIRVHFTDLVGRCGRERASRIWAEAVRSVAAEYPLDPPTLCAPDCVGFCAESYIDEFCEPCQVLEAARRPATAAGPYACGCGVVIPADRDEEILDHIDRCSASTKG